MSMLSTLTTIRNQQNLHIIDNEASNILKQGLLKNKIKYQLVPPHLHRPNASERDIQTFKANFITCLCTAEPDYPAKEWDRFLPQATLSLKLLRKRNFNPKLSSYAALHGIFDNNKKTIYPIGTRVLLREKTTNCRTWAPNGTDRWYIGPHLEHYQCVE